MSEQFKVGDIVRLKSGGPKMTVESIESSGAAFCVWFDETPQGSLVKVRGFPPDVLMPGSPAD